MNKPTVAIIGVGLIGGSLGQALRRSGRYRVLGIARRADTLSEAKRRGAIDSGSLHLNAVAEADLVVLATPVALVVPTLKKIIPYLKLSAWITDVSSVKGEILDGAAPLLKKRPDLHFVGAHPLAGSHKTGVSAARPDLFKGATCVLVPLGRTAPGAVQTLWRSTGARTLVLSAAQHDAAVALTSHLPHLVAHALVSTFARRRERALLTSLLAGSFRDVTRVAAADPDQWAQIFQANQPAVRRALTEFLKELKTLQSLLPKAGLAPALRRSHQFRAPLFHDSPPSPRLRRTSPVAQRA